MVGLKAILSESSALNRQTHEEGKAMRTIKKNWGLGFWTTALVLLVGAMWAFQNGFFQEPPSMTNQAQAASQSSKPTDISPNPGRHEVIEKRTETSDKNPEWCCYWCQTDPDPKYPGWVQGSVPWRSEAACEKSCIDECKDLRPGICKRWGKCSETVPPD